MLAFGWGQWEVLCKQERMQKHLAASVRILAASIIGQLARIVWVGAWEGLHADGGEGGRLEEAERERYTLGAERSRGDSLAGGAVRGVWRAVSGGGRVVRQRAT